MGNNTPIFRELNSWGRFAINRGALTLLYELGQTVLISLLLCSCYINELFMFNRKIFYAICIDRTDRSYTQTANK